MDFDFYERVTALCKSLSQSWNASFAHPSKTTSWKQVDKDDYPEILVTDHVGKEIYIRDSAFISIHRIDAEKLKDSIRANENLPDELCDFPLPQTWIKFRDYEGGVNHMPSLEDPEEFKLMFHRAKKEGLQAYNSRYLSLMHGGPKLGELQQQKLRVMTFGCLYDVVYEDGKFIEVESPEHDDGFVYS